MLILAWDGFTDVVLRALARDNFNDSLSNGKSIKIILSNLNF